MRDPPDEPEPFLGWGVLLLERHGWTDACNSWGWPNTPGMWRPMQVEELTAALRRIRRGIVQHGQGLGVEDRNAAMRAIVADSRKLIDSNTDASGFAYELGANIATATVRSDGLS